MPNEAILRLTESGANREARSNSANSRTLPPHIRANSERDRTNGRAQTSEQVPRPDEIEKGLGEFLVRLAKTSFDFADLLHRLLPEFVICPVREEELAAARITYPRIAPSPRGTKAQG